MWMGHTITSWLADANCGMHLCYQMWELHFPYYFVHSNKCVEMFLNKQIMAAGHQTVILDQNHLIFCCERIYRQWLLRHVQHQHEKYIIIHDAENFSAFHKACILLECCVNDHVNFIKFIYLISSTWPSALGFLEVVLVSEWSTRGWCYFIMIVSSLSLLHILVRPQV